ncbi:hypothetical protein DOY81_009155 [Sarcophaga bullata]|nr:hypothetical protein DOY81_009155 [Sarcophaga bullata]
MTMDSDKVVRAMARWWQTVSQEDSDPHARNPMLYDPLQDGVVKTSKKMQYVAALIVCLGAVAAGTALAWTSPVLPQISVPDTASNETVKTWVSSLLAIGAFLGALPTGYIADAIGRRYTALAMDVPFIVAWICTIFAKSAKMLYFARFTIGLATGSFCVIAPMYISEIAEDSTYKRLFGYIVPIVIECWHIAGLYYWRFGVLDDIKCLCLMGRRGDAALSLKWLWGRYCDSRSAIQTIQTELDQAGSNASFTDIFRIPSARRGLIISMLLMVFQQFSGVNAVIFYTVPIFKSAGSTLDPSLCSIIVGFVQVSMTFASSLLIEKAGRKSLLLFSSTIMTICLAILGSYFDMKDSGKDVSSLGWLPLLCVVMFMVTFSMGYGPVPWLMMGELFLPDVKATAVA